MKSLLSACCFFCVLALSTAGKLEDCDGLFQTFQFHLLFSLLSDLKFRADMLSIEPE